MVSPGLCPLRALPWSLGVCQTRSLTLRPKLLDKPLGLFLRKMRGVLLSTLWAVAWEQLSAKNYLLDYDPRQPREHKPSWPPEPSHQGADRHSSYQSRVTRCKIRTPDVCTDPLQELLVLWSEAEGECKDGALWGNKRGRGENKGKQRKKRKMVFASFYKAEGEHGGCDPPAGLLLC